MSQPARSKQRRRRSKKRPAPGTSPGLLVTDPEAAPTKLGVISYGPDGSDRRELAVDQIKDLLGKRPVTWVDVQGLGDTNLLSALGKALEIHPLVLEDVVNTFQRPKLEQYGQQLFIVMRMTRPQELKTEQLAIVLGSDYVVTFQEEPGDGFDPVRERIRGSGARIRKAGPDYLAYALLDAATDGYFPLLERYGDRLDELELRIMDQRRQEDLIPQLYELLRDLQTVRRNVWPLRELLGRLSKGDLPGVTDTTAPFLRDCYDHASQLLDAADTYHDQASGLIQVVLGMAGQRMNEIMKVLTIMASIFIPLTFIAGIYGMNFDPGASPWNMPELDQPWGYPIVLLVMGVTVAVMLFSFRRRGWIGSRSAGSEHVPGPEAERDRRD